jgi:pyruvate formate lyase activating enzyme
MQSDPKGLVFNIQRFSVNDGPGIRTTVFMKGCNLRCFWCHNPESIRPLPELQFTASRCIDCGVCAAVCPHAEDGRTARFTPRCDACGQCAEACYGGALNIAGRPYEAEELASTLLTDRDMMLRYAGGITFSGGEPLLQADFVRAVLTRLKERDIHTAIETAANLPWETLERVLPLTDLFLCDIKAFSGGMHREGTGADNTLILENIRRLDGAGKKLLLRVPVIPGFNDTDTAIRETGAFVQTLDAGQEIELLPFHNMCAGKYDALGREFAARNLAPPPDEVMRHLTMILKELHVNVIGRNAKP